MDFILSLLSSYIDFSLLVVSYTAFGLAAVMGVYTIVLLIQEAVVRIKGVLR